MSKPKPAPKAAAPTRRAAASKTTTRKPAAKSAPARSASRAKTPRADSKPKMRAPRKQRSITASLSPERKIDLVGVFLALAGLLTALSLLSANRGSLTGAWVEWLAKGVGWGVYILPFGLMLVGMWLLLRNVERLPLITFERLLGAALLFLNLLAWFHFFASGDEALAAAGKGGGWIGQIVTGGLVATFGSAGAAIALAAWSVVALAFTLDLSVSEIFAWVPPLIARMRAALEGRRQARPASYPNLGAPIPYGERSPEQETSSNGFSPLPRAEPGEYDPEETQPYPVSDRGQRAVPASQGTGGNPAASGPDLISLSNQPATPWVRPPVDAILEPGIHAAADDTVTQQRARLIEDTLKSFGAPGHIVEIHRGPTITQFGVEPDFVENRAGRTRVRVSKIVALADDLALALAASRIRIQAPVPGRAYVGIEVPNNEVSRVALRDVMDSEGFRKVKSPLAFALGEDVAGRPISADLAAMPHLLIAGTTGSGKSVCVNSILSAFLINNTPDDLRLILVDPKRVELTGYNGVPHLLAPVVTDAEKVVGALQWMMREMDNRYQKFAQVGARNIVEYNNKLQARGEKRIPYLVVVIDELADLMMLAPDETERTITRLAQLARATGLHLILATQRPSVDVLTGLIKANFPARIAFAVASGVDSRVILDQPGAERLLGRGDMLFQAPDAPAPARLQGVYVSETEINRLVEYWRAVALTAAPDATQTLMPSDTMPRGVPLKQVALWDEEMGSKEEGDPLLRDATDLVRREGRASISLLQRKMRIGYTRAARMIDTLESKGIIGPVQPNSQVREILDYGPTAPPEDNGA